MRVNEDVITCKTDFIFLPLSQVAEETINVCQEQLLFWNSEQILRSHQHCSRKTTVGEILSLLGIIPFSETGGGGFHFFFSPPLAAFSQHRKRDAKLTLCLLGTLVIHQPMYIYTPSIGWIYVNSQFNQWQPVIPFRRKNAECNTSATKLNNPVYINILEIQNLYQKQQKLWYGMCFVPVLCRLRVK